MFDEAAGGLRLGDENDTATSPHELSGTFGGLTRPTGLAVGADGRLFLADPASHRLLTYTTQQAAFVPLWEPRTTLPPDPYTLSGPRGVAISRTGDLVVADTGHGRLIVYTWPGLAVRHVIELGDGEPWDVAYDHRDYLYVADAATGRVARFDRLWRPDGRYAGGAAVLKSPRHLAIDQAGSVLVLDVVLRAIVALDDAGDPVAAQGETPVLAAGGQPLPPLVPKLFQRVFPAPLRLDQQGLWLLQEGRPDCPALLLTGLQVDRRGRLLGQGSPLLALPVTVRYPGVGTFTTKALDSGIFQCAWHRLVFDVDIPVATSLAVRTLTAPAALEPARVTSLPDSQWSLPVTIGPQDWPEVLVQSPPGRYLWVDIRLNSGGAATPLVRSLTIYAPRQSSLNELPPVFREDAVSAAFLDRFLSYFDTVFEEIDSQIERFTGYLDPDGIPAGDFLAWLGSWFAVEFLAEWSDATRREFVRQAISLYKQRGTVAGLQAILRLHAAVQPPHPMIIEHFRLRDYHTQRQIGTADLVADRLYLAGMPLAPEPHELPHHFTVLLPSQAAADDAALATLHRLIEAQKPAHTRYQLRLVEAGVRIGCQSSIGIDMLIGSYPAAPLGEMGLAQSSRLAPLPPRVGEARLLFSSRA
jgi:phage tail-like protein